MKNINAIKIRSIIRNTIQSLYLTRLFFILFFSCVLLLAFSSLVEWMRYLATTLFIALFIITLLDVSLLFFVLDPISYERTLSKQLNLGDANSVRLFVRNNTNFKLSFKLYEGYPVEMQKRSFAFKSNLSSKEELEFSYEFVPKKRGVVIFRKPFFMISSFFNLANRGIYIAEEQVIKVYPSILQLKKYELLVFHHQRSNLGIKRIRRLGNNSEFEQIKEYVQGDEMRMINWKATSRTNVLMTNIYQEQKSQSVFCVLDKSRMMQVESEELSLLDYSINSILAFSNVLLKNGDKVGLITFSYKIDTQLPANKNKLQMQKILNALYNQQTEFKNANYELILQSIRQTVKTRSLIVLFTNFETETAFNRVLPYLLQISQKHVLVVVLFENEDLKSLAFDPPKTIRGVYQNIVAEQMINVTLKLVHRLQQNNIQTIYTTSENLSIKTINKYLELKAKGLL